MPISFNKEKQIFKLDTIESTYALKIWSDGHLTSLYYGAYVNDDNLDNMRHREGVCSSFSPYFATDNWDSTFAPDMTNFEYPTTGVGDYRLTAFSTRSAEGDTVCDLRYADHRIFSGKHEINGLPSSYADSDSEVTTLEIDTIDNVTGAFVTLVYSVFEDIAVTVRSVRVENRGERTFYIEKIASACVNLPVDEYEMIHMHGKYAKEHKVARNKLGYQTQSIRSTRGSSGHNQNPFLAMARKGSTEDHGDVYGFALVYSGNFSIDADMDFFGSPRVTAGINPEDFLWRLEPGEVFSAPEVLLAFSEDGVGGMSRVFHRFISKHIVRGEWRDKKRPLLINSWEAASFNFDDEKLVAFAERVAGLGVEMLVMDDGWFGKRNDSSSSLGDWYVNEDKLKGGLGSLIERVNNAGLKFGIWYEPEMISENSDLYRAHPDWCLRVEGRAHSIARSQLMLDMTRQDVRDNIFEQMYNVLSKYNIDYLKWDMNRNFTQAASSTLPPERQGELAHRYMLGTYELLDRITKTFPHILLESCSGGGGRYDVGMLCYSPQVWTSDNTDAADRLIIQFGTSLCYPASTMGSHVSFSRRTNFKTKADVAMWGSFGYELDPLRLTDEEKEMVKTQVGEYHKYYDIIHRGDLYRLIYPGDAEGNMCMWQFVSEDKNEALLTLATPLAPFHGVLIPRLRGLDPEKMYKDEESGEIYSGQLLMKAGYNMSLMPKADFGTVVRYFKAVN